jgi:hypothetical protein
VNSSLSWDETLTGLGDSLTDFCLDSRLRALGSKQSGCNFGLNRVQINYLAEWQTMKLNKIDLSQVVAIGHEGGKLGILLDRGEGMEYLEIPAPEVAYQGLAFVSSLSRTLPAGIESRYLIPLEDDYEDDDLLCY